MSTWASIVLAGGSGSRMGAGFNKILLQVGGQAIISRSVRTMQRHSDLVVLVVRKDDEKDIRSALQKDGIDVASLRFAVGGDTRQASVYNGLAQIPDTYSEVLVHDGARCLIDDATIERVKAAVLVHGSGIPAVSVTDTIKQASADGQVLATPDRSTLRAVQTPQGMRADILRKAHGEAIRNGFVGTDDASLLEYIDCPVYLTEGNRNNIKVTIPEDLAMAERILGARQPLFRIGQGYDVHAFAENRDLILCGVKVPHERGLLGHSDADVATHALMDALLGALALGDIGQHFPDTDPAYAGADSIKLLQHVTVLIQQRGAEIANVDVTIVAQRPKLAAYIPQMRQNLANAMGIDSDRVSVKATTSEHLGFEGRQEGISAQAVCLLQQKSSIDNA